VIFTQFGGNVAPGPRKKRLDFGVNWIWIRIQEFLKGILPLQYWHW